VKLFLLLVALTMSAFEGGLDLTPPTSGPVVDGGVIVTACDRLVCARVKKIHEFDFVSGKPTIRIAELDLMRAAQPFGSKWERVLVRLVDPGPPPDLAYWPLSRNLMLNERDSTVFATIEPSLKTEQLWMPRLGFDGPWPVEERDGTYRAHVPSTIIKGKIDAPAVEPKSVEMQWIPQGEVHRAVVAELKRIETRTEAVVTSSGPSNWRVTVDGDGHGNANGASFQWTKEQRDSWSAALDAAHFSTMPPSVGGSTGPCSSVLSLSVVTMEGRRTVRCYGPVKTTPIDKHWVPEFDKLWSVLRQAVPPEPK